MAVCAARGRLRAGAAAGDSAERILLSSAVLRLRRGAAEPGGLRTAEFTRLQGTQGLAGAPAAWPRWLRRVNRRRHAALAEAASAHGAAPALRGALAVSQHRDVQICARQSAI